MRRRLRELLEPFHARGMQLEAVFTTAEMADLLGLLMYEVAADLSKRLDQVAGPHLPTSERALMRVAGVTSTVALREVRSHGFGPYGPHRRQQPCLFARRGGTRTSRARTKMLGLYLRGTSWLLCCQEAGIEGITTAKGFQMAIQHEVEIAFRIAMMPPRLGHAYRSRTGDLVLRGAEKATAKIVAEPAPYPIAAGRRIHEAKYKFLMFDQGFSAATLERIAGLLGQTRGRTLPPAPQNLTVADALRMAFFKKLRRDQLLRGSEPEPQEFALPEPESD